MELIKDKWSTKDIAGFQKYLSTFGNVEKVDWTKNILNTEMKVLAVKAQQLKKIASSIAKGNFLSFLDLNIKDTYENTYINACLISRIKNFDTLQKYLDAYVSTIDNWASCDALSFKVKNNEENFLQLSKRYLKDSRPFVRRVAVIILFKFTQDKYMSEIYKVINSLKNETHYYVNMVAAWLLCECFIKCREQTLAYYDSHNTNKFIINKSIQKCRDSYRVSDDDKTMLLKYKIK